MASSGYYTAFLMTQNTDLMMRIAASAQQETEPGSDIDPEAWARDRRWDWSTKSDWIAAVQGAIDNGITAWGMHPGVVTDGHILSYVQSAMA